MRRQKPLTSWVLTACVSAAAGCDSAGSTAQVDFGDSQAIGRWEPETADSNTDSERAPQMSPATMGTAGAAAATARPAASTNTSTGVGLAPTAPQTGAAGAAEQTQLKGMQQSMAAMDTAGGSGGSASAAPGAAAGDGETAQPADTAEPAVSSLVFTVKTEPVGGRYRPKNIGAIWIADDGGKLVKSLEVWARIRARYLTKYAAARGIARVDVTASATLTSHKTHMASWDLKDTTGSRVEPGKYTLFAEITDADATGKFVAIDFDTSAGPSSMSPASSTGFTGMQLELK